MQAQQEMYAIVAVVAALFILFFFLMIAVVFGSLYSAWMRGFLSGAPVSIIQLLGMRLRGEPPKLIVDALITLVHRGHPFGREMCYLAESTYLAKRGLVQTPEQLADFVEKELASRKS